MRKSKGQFLIISAIFIGVMIISVSSTIAEIQSQELSMDSAAYEIDTVKTEVSKIDPDDSSEVEGLRETLSQMPDYRTDVATWDRNSDGTDDCLNVTMRKHGTYLEMNCLD